MTQLNCRHCNHWLLPSDRFCEACGTAVARPTCPTCGASAEKTDDEGFCTGCGFRHPQAPEQREEILSDRLAGLSDRGLHHRTNQDAFAIGELPEGTTILTVYDGISSSPRAELVAQTAAIVMMNQITMALTADRRERSRPQGSSSQGSSSQDAQRRSPVLTHPMVTKAVLARSLQQAQQEVVSLSSENVESPSTTVVSAIVEPDTDTPQVTLAWLGDSRAYWLAPSGSQLLTQDHANAEQALTRWLGGDADLIRDPPQFSQFQIPGPGYLLLCSDGLWKYAPKPEQLQQLLYQQIPDPSHPPQNQALVRSLIQFARQRGGHDNITATLQAF